MKKIKKFRPISGDINTNAALYLNKQEKGQEGLGLISELVSAAGDVASLLMHVFKKPPADTWGIWNHAERTKYVKQSLQLATTAVITGKTISVRNTFRGAIAHVDPNNRWDKWEKKNSEFLPALFGAEDEVKEYQATGYKPYMQYVNPEMVNRVLHPATAASSHPAQAGMISTNTILLVVGLGVGAIIIKELVPNREDEFVKVMEANMSGKTGAKRK